MGEDFLRNVEKYVRARHTSSIEAFNAHTLLTYCPKRLHFSYDIYKMKNQLAVLDHNNHCQRGIALILISNQMCFSLE